MRATRPTLLILFGFVCIGYGLIAGRFELFPFHQAQFAFHTLGAIFRTEPETTRPRPEQLTEDALQQIEALGYVGSHGPAPKESGVTVHRPELSFGGEILYVSAHAPEARLIDFAGEPLHMWTHRFDDACPDVAIDPDQVWRTEFWRRARLLPDGDLLAVFDYQALIRLDRHSNLKWVRCGEYHHDFSVDAAGRIYALRRERRSLSRIHEEYTFLDDWIEVLAPDGTPIKTVSVAEAFLDSPYASHFARVNESWLRANGDILHTNTVEFLDGRHAGDNPAFRAGNVLIALRYLDLVAAVDLEAKRVVWAISGMWRKPHDPVLLGNGNLLIFDNLGRGGRSQVLEIDPATQQVVWSYPDEGGRDLLTKSCGAVQRLANGNTLLTVSEAGRVLEVTREGRVAWEFVNPHRIEGRIAAIWEAVRVDPGSVRRSRPQ